MVNFFSSPQDKNMVSSTVFDVSFSFCRKKKEFFKELFTSTNHIDQLDCYGFRKSLGTKLLVKIRYTVKPIFHRHGALFFD